MKYLVVPFGAIALALVFLAIPTTRTSAAPRPTPTPTPVAIGYDEIVRAAMMGATPVPPGQFEPDRANIMSSAPSAGSGESSATPTPAAKHRGGLGGMLGAAMSGNLGGGMAGGGPQGNPSNPMSGLNSMQLGSLKRYTYYWLHNWVRIDDPVAQTATIEKCNQHQFIYLDLAKKTYRIQETAKPCNTPTNPYGGHGSAAAAQMGPGTSTITMTSTATGLGPKTLESIPTNGYNSSMQMAMSNATGSCHDMNMKMETLAYISQIGKQRAYCPLPANAGGGSFMPGSASGGCKPTIAHTNMTGNVHPPTDKLEMYLRTTMDNPTGQGPAFSNVTERGRVAWYYRPDADALFSVPPGFTQDSSTE